MTRLDHGGNPWRWTCPDCGSHDLHYATGRFRPKGKTYSCYRPGEASADRSAAYRCGECAHRMNRVYDKKLGRLVRDV